MTVLRSTHRALNRRTITALDSGRIAAIYPALAIDEIVENDRDGEAKDKQHDHRLNPSNENLFPISLRKLPDHAEVVGCAEVPRAAE
jgi:hypothetical protein